MHYHLIIDIGEFKLYQNTKIPWIIKVAVAQDPLMAPLMEAIILFPSCNLCDEKRYCGTKKWNRKQKSEVSIKKSAEY